MNSSRRDKSESASQREASTCSWLAKFCVAGLLIYPAIVLAESEEEEEEEPNRFELAPFPVIAGNTDLGFKFGADVSVVRIEENYSPFRYRLGITASLSVKSSPEGGADFPEHDYRFRCDFPGLLDDRFRITANAGYQRTINAGYYGLQGLSERDPLGRIILDGGRDYQYIRQGPVVDLDSRIALGESSLELLMGSHYRYTFPRDYADSLLRQDSLIKYEDGSSVLIGFNNHSLFLLRLGLLWDRRDHEVAPTRGAYLEVSVRSGLGVPSEAHLFGYGGVTTDFRVYTPLIDNHYLTLAARIVGDVLFGDVPFYMLSEMGTFFQHGFSGSQGVRGSPEGRHAGELKLLGAMELRTLFAPFTLFRTRMVFGMLISTSVGQSWATLDPQLPFEGRGPRAVWSVGYGLLLRWGEAIMIRIEVDYCPDTSDAGNPVGFYMDVGHAF